MPPFLPAARRRAAATVGAGLLAAACFVHIVCRVSGAGGSMDAPAAMDAAKLSWTAADGARLAAVGKPRGAESKAHARAKLAEKHVSELKQGGKALKAAESRARLLFDDWGGIRKEREAKEEQAKEESAIQKEEVQSSVAKRAGAKEFDAYNILSFSPPLTQALPLQRARETSQPDRREGGQRRGRENEGSTHVGEIGDASAGETARYAKVAGAGAEAYEAALGSSSDNQSYKEAEALALKRAKHLLQRYKSSAVLGIHQTGVQQKTAKMQPAVGRFKVGDAVTARSATGHWRPAGIEREGRGDTAGELLVHFDGFEHKYDEWIRGDSHRLEAASHFLLAGERATAETDGDDVSKLSGPSERSGERGSGRGRAEESGDTQRPLARVLSTLQTAERRARAMGDGTDESMLQADERRLAKLGRDSEALSAGARAHLEAAALGVISRLDSKSAAMARLQRKAAAAIMRVGGPSRAEKLETPLRTGLRTSSALGVPGSTGVQLAVTRSEEGEVAAPASGGFPSAGASSKAALEPAPWLKSSRASRAAEQAKLFDGASKVHAAKSLDEMGTESRNVRAGREQDMAQKPPEDQERCWEPILPTIRAPLCTPKEEEDGTCKQVWSDLPEIVGSVESFMLVQADPPQDEEDELEEDAEPTLRLKVFSTEKGPSGALAMQDLGLVEARLGARADGVEWMRDDGGLVAKSRPWSIAGWFSDAPDMRVGDCAGNFLAVLNMEPIQGPAGQRAPRLRASIRTEDGDESFYVEMSKFHILGQSDGEVDYHVFTKGHRLVAMLRRSDPSKSKKLEWMVELEKESVLDVRVAVILAAQLQAEGMRGAGWMLMLAIVGLCLLLFNAVSCCVASRLIYRWARSRRGKTDDELELGQPVGHPRPYQEGPKYDAFPTPGRLDGSLAKGLGHGGGQGILKSAVGAPQDPLEDVGNLVAAAYAHERAKDPLLLAHENRQLLPPPEAAPSRNLDAGRSQASETHGLARVPSASSQASRASRASRTSHASKGAPDAREAIGSGHAEQPRRPATTAMGSLGTLQGGASDLAELKLQRTLANDGAETDRSELPPLRSDAAGRWTVDANMLQRTDSSSKLSAASFEHGERKRPSLRDWAGERAGRSRQVGSREVSRERLSRPGSRAGSIQEWAANL